MLVLFHHIFYYSVISNWTNIHKVLIDDIKNMKDAKEEPKKEEKPPIEDEEDIDLEGLY